MAGKGMDDKRSAGGDRVAETRCRGYGREEVQKAVSDLFNADEQFSRFIRPGDRVLLKVNMLSPKLPKRATTTHPEVVRAAAQIVHDAGGHAVIGDSMGAPMRMGLINVGYRKTGYRDIADEGLAELNRNMSSMKASNPSGRLIRSFDLCSMIDDVDKVIALPKVKTHQLCTLTCAAKILFGLVPGTLKPGYHAKLPDVDHFGQMLVDLTELIRRMRPTLFLADGIVAMEGEGPSWGETRSLETLLLSADPHKLDLEVCRLVGIDPELVNTLRAARAFGLLGSGVEEPVVVGEGPEPVSTPFAIPKVRDAQVRIPEFLKRFFKNQPNPRPAMSDKCILCGECVETCPVDAIEATESALVFDYAKCIRCYCCDELCPSNGIKAERPFLGRLIWG